MAPQSNRRRRWSDVLLVALVTALALVEPVAAQTASPPAYPALFGTREVRSRSLAPFQKWTGMLERQIVERALYNGPCTARRLNRCHLQEWHTLLANLAGKDKLAQIEAVNAFMNRAAYVVDPVNYGVPDYWATPLQFFAKDGDCEDYAIAKFVSLKRLGFTNEQMRLVVLDDLNLQIAHAILVVYIGSRAFVLDNQIPKVVPAEVIHHYRPIYSINEDGWWLHRP
jgi:predicted transglutaminase-like cysteine proteinase